MLVITYRKQSRHSYLFSWGIPIIRDKVIGGNYLDNLILLGLFPTILLPIRYKFDPYMSNVYHITTLELGVRRPGLSFWGYHLLFGLGPFTLSVNIAVFTNNKETMAPVQSYLTLPSRGSSE